MIISTITGSKEPTDNWTSLYTFILGLVAGGFVAVGIGEVDMAENLRGDLMRVYLTLITAIIAGGVAFAVSRTGDRIADRRKQKRAILLLLNDLQSLSAAMEAYRTAIPARDITVAPYTLREAQLLLTAAETVRRIAARLPNFTDTIDDLEDLDRSNEVRQVFEHAARFFAHKPTDGLTDGAIIAEATTRFRPLALEYIAEQIAELESAVMHFGTRLDSL